MICLGMIEGSPTRTKDRLKLTIRETKVTMTQIPIKVTTNLNSRENKVATLRTTKYKKITLRMEVTSKLTLQ
jgi:hypothetical protein